MRNLYFAHNFNNRKKFREIELILEKELGIIIFNPFYDDISRKKEMQYLNSIDSNAITRMKQLKEKLKKSKRRFSQNLSESQLIVSRDLSNLAKCDGLLSIIDEPSIGTTIEICNAKLMCKPIFIIAEKYTNHPWLVVYADKIFKSVDEFKTYWRSSYED